MSERRALTDSGASRVLGVLVALGVALNIALVAISPG